MKRIRNFKSAGGHVNDIRDNFLINAATRTDDK